MVRYAGDEFVVVAPGAEPEQILARVELLRERLKFERGRRTADPLLRGHAYLPVNGEPEAALRAADEAMYRDKAVEVVGRRRAFRLRYEVAQRCLGMTPHPAFGHLFPFEGAGHRTRLARRLGG